MIKVLVVEDEPPILRNICRKIMHTHNSFEISGTAYNGQEAIKFLDQNTVDIVFTDISMPIVDGIGLLKYISENFPDIKVVLISGYQEFSYAKNALKYGAADYLLKPLEEAQVRSLLDRLFAEYQLKQKSNAQSLLFSSGQLSGSKVFSRQAENDCSLYMVLLCIGSIASAPPDKEEKICAFWNDLDLESLLADSLPEGLFFWVIPGKAINENIVILNDIPDKQINRINTIFKKITSQSPFPLHAIISEEINSMNHIKQKYDSLKQLLRRSLIFGRSAFYREKKLLSSTPAGIKLEESNELKIAAQKGNFKHIQKLIRQDLLQFDIAQATQIYIELYLRNTLLVCNREGFIKLSLIDIETNVQLLISNSPDYTNLSEDFISLLWSCHAESIQATANDTQTLINKIDQYIRQHLATPITNQMLSAKFGLSPSYLSRLFKEYKKLTPAEYITRLRIEKARQLLSDSPELLIKDIAQIVGYSDPLYFSRVFKKNTGVYPTEYQNTTGKKLL